MAERALDDLLEIMRDQRVGMRQKINAAISASRVSPLAMPGEAPPEAIVFLRHVIDYKQEGTQFAVEWRRESAAALSFWERRCKKAELLYQAPDTDEQQRRWRGILNGCIRVVLFERKLWPARRDILFTAADEIDVAGLPDPELALSALFLPAGANRHARRRLKAIDERVAGVFTGNEAERRAVIKPIADIVEARLKAFGLEQSMGQKPQHHTTAAETLA